MDKCQAMGYNIGMLAIVSALCRKDWKVQSMRAIRAMILGTVTAVVWNALA